MRVEGREAPLKETRPWARLAVARPDSLWLRVTGSATETTLLGLLGGGISQQLQAAINIH